MDPRPDLCVVEIRRGLGGFPVGLRFKSSLLWKKRHLYSQEIERKDGLV